MFTWSFALVSKINWFSWVYVICGCWFNISISKRFAKADDTDMGLKFVGPSGTSFPFGIGVTTETLKLRGMIPNENMEV